MAQSETNRERIVDLLKGICILLVCFTHYGWEESHRRALLFPWWVDMAVPIFMVLSGYVYGKSLKRRTIVSLSQLYSHSEILKKLVRFTIPVLIVYILTLIWDARKYPEIPYAILNTFLQGGRGKGSYYYPIMVQTVFVLPVIGIIVTRYKEKGLLICLIANIVYEIFHVAYNIPVESYRLLMFRYIFVLAAGCYISMGHKTTALIPIAMFCCGVLFLFAYQYMGYSPLYVIHWTGTSFIASMYVIPIVWFLLKRCKLHFAPVEFLGKASYHIFVMQMLYYYTVAPLVYQHVSGGEAKLLVCMICCIGLGILLYFIETPVRKFLQKRIDHILK